MFTNEQYLQKVIRKNFEQKLVGILSAIEEKSRIRIRKSLVRIRTKMSRIYNTAPRTQKSATNLASADKKTKVLVLDSWVKQNEMS